MEGCGAGGPSVHQAWPPWPFSRWRMSSFFRSAGYARGLGHMGHSHPGPSSAWYAWLCLTRLELEEKDLLGQREHWRLLPPPWLGSRPAPAGRPPLFLTGADAVLGCTTGAGMMGMDGDDRGPPAANESIRRCMAECSRGAPAAEVIVEVGTDLSLARPRSLPSSWGFLSVFFTFPCFLGRY